MFSSRCRPVLVATAVAIVSAATLATTASAAPIPTIPPVAAQRTAAAPSVKPLPANGHFDYQIGGAYKPAATVTVVSRDRSNTPVVGLYNICYVNAFQTQPDDKKWWTKEHPTLLVHHKKKLVEDPDWEGEFMLDTSTLTHRRELTKIVGAWVDDCAARGFDAVEFDNLDSWTRSKKELSKENNVAFATRLTNRAHDRGLAAAQKNTPELGTTGRDQVGFDFAVAEECQVYGECADYERVYGNRWVEIEYTDNARKFYAQACSARKDKISVILRDRDVTLKSSKSYVYQEC